MISNRNCCENIEKRRSDVARGREINEWEQGVRVRKMRENSEIERAKRTRQRAKARATSEKKVFVDVNKKVGTLNLRNQVKSIFF